MMVLKKCEPHPYGATVTYEVKHYGKGRSGTVLTNDLELQIGTLIGGKCVVRMRVDDCEGASPKEALDRMAQWLRRLAKAIEDRKETPLPL